MRKTIWFSILAGALFAGTACKKDNSDTTDKAGTELRKAEEAVADQKGDVREEMKDVREEAKDVRQEAKDVPPEIKDVAVAQADFGAAKAAYVAKVGERLGKLDARLAELASKADGKYKQLAVDLKVKREALGERTKLITTQAQMDFDKFTTDVDSQFDAIEHPLFDALDN